MIYTNESNNYTDREREIDTDEIRIEYNAADKRRHQADKQSKRPFDYSNKIRSEEEEARRRKEVEEQLRREQAEILAEKEEQER